MDATVLPVFALALAIVLKLSPALLLIYFVMRRRWQVIGFALIGLIVLSGLPLLQFGLRPVLDFVRVTLETLGNSNTIGANIGLAAMLSRLGIPGATLLSRALLVVSVASFAVMAWKRNSAAIFSLFILVMLELSPLVWLHHFVFFVIVLALISPPGWRWQIGVIAALVLVQSEPALPNGSASPVG